MSVRFRALMSCPPDWHFVWQLPAGAALFLVTVVGLLLPPVRGNQSGPLLIWGVLVLAPGL